jgi:ATP-dependent Clp protease ATP-binding subunit ClpA
LIDFEVAQLVLLSKPDDLVKSFLESEIGMMTLDRLNVPDASTTYFIKNPDRKKLREGVVQFLETERGETSMVIYAAALYKHNSDFAYFLEINFIDETSFLEAVQWADELIYTKRAKALFLSRERLERIPSIGKAWAHTRLSMLEKYCMPIFESRLYTSLGNEWRMYKKEAQEVENILARKPGQNVMLIAPTIESGMEIMSALGHIVARGNALYSIEGKYLYFLSTEKFLNAITTKEEFESALGNVLDEARTSRDIILILPQTSALIAKAFSLGAEMMSVVKEFLQSQDLHIVAVVDSDEYHHTIVPHREFTRYFDPITFNKIDHKTLQRIIKDQVQHIESELRVFYTYQAVRDVARKFAGPSIDGTYLLAIVKYLRTLAERVREQGDRVVTAQHVASLE